MYCKVDDLYYYTEGSQIDVEKGYVSFICKRCNDRCRKIGYLLEFKSLKRSMLCSSCNNSQVSKYRKETMIKNGIYDKRCKDFSEVGKKTLTKFRSKLSKDQISELCSKAGKKNYEVSIKNNSKFFQNIYTKEFWNKIRENPEKYQFYILHLTNISRNNWNNYTPEEKNNRLKKSFKNISRSKVSEEFKQWLKQNNLYQGFKSEQWIKGYKVDELSEEKKLIIEFYGDIYHCNPVLFKEENQYCSWLDRTVKEQWDRDRKRIEDLLKYGYSIIIIWESDYYNDKERLLERLIKEIR